MKISLNDFRFIFKSYGRYNVIYTSPKTGKEYKNYTTDMELIDVTKNSDNPKVKDLNYLKSVCKSKFS